MAIEACGECVRYDNMMHRVAWAQIHSISFPTDRNVNFNGQILFFFNEFQQDFEKEIEFQKCSFKLLNVILIKESNCVALLSL